MQIFGCAGLLSGWFGAAAAAAVCSLDMHPSGFSFFCSGSRKIVYIYSLGERMNETR